MNCNCNPNRGTRRPVACLETVIAFFAVLLALAIGGIVGVANATALQPVLTTIIVFAVALAVILITLILYWFRCGQGNC